MSWTNHLNESNLFNWTGSENLTCFESIRIGIDKFSQQKSAEVIKKSWLNDSYQYANELVSINSMSFYALGQEQSVKVITGTVELCLNQLETFIRLQWIKGHLFLPEHNSRISYVHLHALRHLTDVCCCCNILLLFCNVLYVVLWRKCCKMANLINSDVFLAFSTYATIVILKMMFMSPLTGYFRVTRKVRLISKIQFEINWN